MSFRKDNLTFEQWQEYVGQVGRASKACLWWWGDLLNYGERKYGEMYAQAMDSSEYTYQTLMQAKYVSSKIKFSIRIENLTFSHHNAVAGLDPLLMVKLLDLASAGDNSKSWTRKKLLEAIAVAKNAMPSAKKANPAKPAILNAH